VCVNLLTSVITECSKICRVFSICTLVFNQFFPFLFLFLLKKGASLVVNSSWKNPSGEWHVGYKFLYELLTDTLTSRLKVKQYNLELKKQDLKHLLISMIRKKLSFFPFADRKRGKRSGTRKTKKKSPRL